MISHLCFGAYLLVVIRAASAQCVYTPTKCQCKREISGNVCLHYSSETMEGTLCQTYECGAGYVCHCKFDIHLYISSQTKKPSVFSSWKACQRNVHFILKYCCQLFIIKQVVATKYVTLVHVKATPSLIKRSIPSSRALIR